MQKPNTQSVSKDGGGQGDIQQGGRRQDGCMAVSGGEQGVYYCLESHACYVWVKQKKVTITSSIASSQRMGYQVSSYK